LSTIHRIQPALVLFALPLLLIPMSRIEAADDEAEPASNQAVSYYRQIRPIFQEHCHGCHQPAKQGGEYVMTDFDHLLKGGETGDAAIVPKSPDKSGLLALITPESGTADMPKDAKPLHETDRKLIEQWILEGAADDSPMAAKSQFDADNPPSYAAAPVITSLAYSPDGKLLAVSGYHEVVLHHADGSGIAARLIGLSERIQSIAFSADGKRLAVTGGNPGRMGELQIWDLERNELLRSLTVGHDTLYGASWSHDGKLVGFGCPDNTIRAIDAETGKQVLFSGAHSDWVLDTVFSVKSDHLVTVGRDRSAKLINVPTQRFVDNITSITPGALKGGLNAVDRHPKQDQIVTGGADGQPKMYRMYREKARKIGDDFNLIRAFPKLQGRVFDVAFSPDGASLIAGSSYNGKGEVQICKVADAASVMKLEVQGGVFAVALHPNNKQAAVGGFDGMVRLIDIKTAKVIKQFPPVELQKPKVAAAATTPVAKK